jgi:hypothetical protein
MGPLFGGVGYGLCLGRLRRERSAVHRIGAAPVVQQSHVHAGRDVVVQVGPSADELVAILERRKLVAFSASDAKPEFTEEEKAIARRAISSTDAITKANAAIVLGRSDEARKTLEPAVVHTAENAFRSFTAMGDSFYFEGRFDEAVPW